MLLTNSLCSETDTLGSFCLELSSNFLNNGNSLNVWIAYVGGLNALIFAALIAWRRPWLVEARMLCRLLIAFVIGVASAANNWIAPWAALDFGAVLVGVPVADSQIALLVAYALLFGRPLSVLRKLIAGAAFFVTAFDARYALAMYSENWSGAWEPLALGVLPLLALATAVAAARGHERLLLVLDLRDAVSSLPYRHRLLSRRKYPHAPSKGYVRCLRRFYSNQ